jgi:hypothetical protein
VASYVKSWETSQDIVHDVFLQYWRRQQKEEPIEYVAGGVKCATNALRW